MGVRSLWMCGLLAMASALPAQMSLEQALFLRAREISPIPTASPLATAVPTNLSEALAGTASEAAIIFVGEVVAIRQGSAAVEIDFHVDAGIRGATAHSTYTLREWSGSWANGASRYRLGQRSLVMLHAPSAAGFSSPVGGGDGILPLHGDTITGELDTRWLATRVLRNAGEAPSLSARQLTVRPTSDPLRPVKAEAGAASSPDRVDCALVLDILRVVTRETRAKAPEPIVAGIR